MKPGVIIASFVILFSLIIYLIITVNNFGTDINNLKDRPLIPDHRHDPIVISESGEEIPVGLNQDQVIRLINEHTPDSGPEIIYSSDNGDMFKTASASELGYEVNVEGNRLNFNKGINFQKDISIAGDLFSSNKVTFNNSDINVISYANMIAPFYVNFDTQENINILKDNHWYLCDGAAHTVGGQTRTTPDLRGRFIWGGGSIEGRSDGQNDTISNFELRNEMWRTELGDSYNNFEHGGGSAVNRLEENQIPSHRHGFVDSYFGVQWIDWSTQPEDQRMKQGSSSDGLVNNPSSYNKYTEYTGSTGVQQARSGTEIQNLPPYMVLAYFIYWPYVRDDAWFPSEPWKQ